jgi:hypothetical protein
LIFGVVNKNSHKRITENNSAKIMLSFFVLNQLALSDLVIACLPLDPIFAGSDPAEDDGFLMAITIRSTTSFGGK